MLTDPISVELPIFFGFSQLAFLFSLLHRQCPRLKAVPNQHVAITENLRLNPVLTVIPELGGVRVMCHKLHNGSIGRGLQGRGSGEFQRASLLIGGD